MRYFTRYDIPSLDDDFLEEAHLPPREMQLLKLRRAGKSEREIREWMNISRRTYWGYRINTYDAYRAWKLSSLTQRGKTGDGKQRNKD